MADPLSLNASGLSSIVREAFPPQIFSGLSFLISIAKIAGVLVLIYIAFLIIQAVVRIRQALRLKSIEQNIIEINKNIQLLVGKKSHIEKKPSKLKS